MYENGGMEFTIVVRQLFQGSEENHSINKQQHFQSHVT
jgi:hypothetical protein